MHKLTKSLLILLFLSFFMVGCSEEDKIVEKNYSEITVLSSQDKSTDILGVKDNKIYKIETMNNVMDLAYNFKKNLYVYQIYVSSGQNLDRNKIQIEKRDQEMVVNNFYNSMDVKVSPEGGKIAYRSFVKDSYESVEGLTIYDINSKKNKKVKTSILVSGNLYNWLNDDEIVYYGISSKSKEHNKLYKYNFKDSSETVYLDNIMDYCTFFSLVKDKGILCLEQGENETRLVYNELGTQKRTVISNSITSISNAVYSEKSNSIFFTGVDKTQDKCQLFKLSLEDLSLTQINYDFPKEVDRNGGLDIDSTGNIYFCGVGNDNNSNQVYMVNGSDQSINLISNEKGKYYLGGNNK